MVSNVPIALIYRFVTRRLSVWGIFGGGTYPANKRGKSGMVRNGKPPKKSVFKILDPQATFVPSPFQFQREE